MMSWIYSDIEVRGAASDKAAHSIALPVMTRLFWVLHGIFTEIPNTYAIALPDMSTGEQRHVGHIVRVFAASEEPLTSLIGKLVLNEQIFGYVRFSKPRKVEENFSGQWVEYQRFRVPNSKVLTQERRLKRLQAAEHWPYFRVKSQSASDRHGQRMTFSLHIARYLGKPGMLFQPDSYGLSRATHPFAVPHII